MHDSASKFQDALQSLLYSRVIQGGVGSAALADALGVVRSTVTRQCTGDIPVQARTVVALASIDSSAAAPIADVFADALGVEWRESPVLREVHRMDAIVERLPEEAGALVSALLRGEASASLSDRVASLIHLLKSLEALLSASSDRAASRVRRAA